MLNPTRIMQHIALAVLISLAVVGCSKHSPTAPNTSRYETVSLDRHAQASRSENGAAGQLPAFYDGRRLTINSVEISGVAAAHVGSNPSHNEIFVTNDLDDPQDFDPVIDAIPTDGFNPLWEQIKIVFNPGVTPRQFTSDDDVLQAAQGAHPLITLVDTHEVYRCAVVAGTSR